MEYEISQTDIWIGAVEDRPGGLAEKLEILTKAGANLEFVLIRRDPENPGMAKMFVSPLRGVAAQEAGLTKASDMLTLRVEGPHRSGLVAKISRALGDAGINMRGVSGAAIADRNVVNIAFESIDELDRASSVLNEIL